MDNPKKSILVYGLKNVRGGLESYLLAMQNYMQNDINMIFIVEDSSNECIFAENILNHGGNIEFLVDRHHFKEYISQFNGILNRYKTSIDSIYINVNRISFDIIPIIVSCVHKYHVYVHSHNARMEPINALFFRIVHSVLDVLSRYLLYILKIKRIAISERAGKYLFLNRTYKYAPPGIEINNFRFNKEKRDEIRRKLCIENHDYLYGFVGRITSVKNPVIALNIFKKVHGINKNTHIVFLGEGPLDIDIRTESKGLEGYVHIIGQVSNVNDYLNAIDCLLAPSESEGLGLSVIEAQANGIFCVCSENRFPKEVNITDLVEYADLQNENEWVNICLQLITKKINREIYTDLVENSIFTNGHVSKLLLDALDLK